MELINHSAERNKLGMSQNRRYFYLVFSLLFSVLFISQSVAGGLIVTWNANSESDLAGYRIYYGTESSSYSANIDVGKVTSYILQNLNEGKTYYVVVTAYDLSGNESLPSIEVSEKVGVPDAFAEITTNGIHLRWTSISGATGYEIYANSDPYFQPSTPVTRVSGNEYIDTFNRKQPGLARYYLIKALSGTTPVFTFDRLGAFNLALRKSRNLVSLPLVPKELSLSKVIGDQLNGATTTALSDKILWWNGREYETAWLIEGSSGVLNGKWVTQSGDQESPIQLNPDKSFWIWLRPGSIDSIVTLTGKISMESNRVITLVQGTNFIGSCYPVPVRLTKSDLAADGVVTGSTSSAGADKLMQWNNNKYEIAWLVDGTGTKWDKIWVDESGSYMSPMLLQPGVGNILWVKKDNPQKVWTYPNPNPNK